MDELGDEIERVVIDIRLVQRHDRRMRQARRRERLAASALAGVGLVGVELVATVG